MALFSQFQLKPPLFSWEINKEEVINLPKRFHLHNSSGLRDMRKNSNFDWSDNIRDARQPHFTRNNIFLSAFEILETYFSELAFMHHLSSQIYANKYPYEEKSWSHLMLRMTFDV